MGSLNLFHAVACTLSHFSCVQLCVTLWTAAHQAPLPTGFSRQEYWSGLAFPSPHAVVVSIIGRVFALGTSESSILRRAREE